MEEISTIGIDIAKSVFQVHAVSGTGEVVVRRQLKRRQVLLFFAWVESSAKRLPSWARGWR
jgi:transposase